MSPARATTASRQPAPEATARLRALLARLRAELLALVLCHGLGTLLAALALGVELLYWIDWGLRAPLPVRLVSTALALAALLWVLRRSVWRPLGSLPSWSGLAALFERARPDLGELYSAAVSLQAARRRGGPGGTGADELVARVLAAADERARADRTAGVLIPAPCWRRLLLGLALAGGAFVHGALRPDQCSTFLSRLVGGRTPWPQRTELEIAIAPSPDLLVLGSDEESTRFRASRGSELAVTVRAHGTVPSDVRLCFSDGLSAPMASVGSREFRFRIAALQNDLCFWAEGGDDRDGLPRIELAVVSPPDVAAVAVLVTPPPYTGIEPGIERDRDVRVPEGSVLAVHVLPDPPQATGRARLLPEDRAIELEPAPFPHAGPAAPAGADTAAEPAPGAGGLRFSLAAERSLRFQIELRDATGLQNPDPGLYSIEVVPDRAPRVVITAPTRTASEITPEGALPLRARAEDDYGLVDLVWRAVRLGSEQKVERRLSPRFSAAAPADGERAPVRAAVAARLEAADLAADGVAPEPGVEFDLEVAAADARAAGPQEGRADPVRVRVVAPDELLRHIQDRLARSRAAVQALWQLQRETRERTLALAQALGGDAPLGSADELALETCLAGQRRVQGDSGALLRDLSGVAESALYARLDPKAGALLEQLDQALNEAPESGFPVAAWRAVAASGPERGDESRGFAAHLLALVEVAIEVASDLAPRASAAVDRARSADDLAAAEPWLSEAVLAQAALLERLEALLESLAEWEDYQSVLSLSRDLLERQRWLRDRTRAAAGGPAGGAEAQPK